MEAGFYSVMEHHAQKQLGEDGVYFILILPHHSPSSKGSRMS